MVAKVYNWKSAQYFCYNYSNFPTSRIIPGHVRKEYTLPQMLWHWFITFLIAKNMHSIMFGFSDKSL